MTQAQAKTFIAIVAASSLLSGCATWTHSTPSDNWYQTGVNEAKIGLTENWRANYHRVNGGAPAGFDRSAYQDGFNSVRQASAQTSTKSDNN